MRISDWSSDVCSSDLHVMEPMLTLSRGRPYLLALHNDTAWHHPIHLHGHSFRVLSRNGTATRHREWQDTVLMAPDERVEIALVADNPGDSMIHCHILEHPAAGMLGVIRVGKSKEASVVRYRLTQLLALIFFGPIADRKSAVKDKSWSA